LGGNHEEGIVTMLIAIVRQDARHLGELLESQLLDAQVLTTFDSYGKGCVQHSRRDPIQSSSHILSTQGCDIRIEPGYFRADLVAKVSQVANYIRSRIQQRMSAGLSNEFDAFLDCRTPRVFLNPGCVQERPTGRIEFFHGISKRHVHSLMPLEASIESAFTLEFSDRDEPGSYSTDYRPDQRSSDLKYEGGQGSHDLCCQGDCHGMQARASWLRRKDKIK
jgi:hypothetical protein